MLNKVLGFPAQMFYKTFIFGKVAYNLKQSFVGGKSSVSIESINKYLYVQYTNRDLPQWFVNVVEDDICACFGESTTKGESKVAGPSSYHCLFAYFLQLLFIAVNFWISYFDILLKEQERLSFLL